MAPKAQPRQGTPKRSRAGAKQVVEASAAAKARKQTDAAKKGAGKKAGAKTAGAKTASAKTAGAKTASAKTASAKTASAKTAGAKKASAKTAGAKKASAETASAKTAGAVPASRTTALAGAAKPTEAPPERELVRMFATLFPAYRDWLRAHLPEAGDMTAPRMRLLGALRMLGPRKMGAVSAHLGLKKASVTALVDGLERDGLVRRLEHPRDRRATLLALTEAGDELSAARYDAYEAGVAGAFADLSPSEQRQLLALMQRVLARVRGE